LRPLFLLPLVMALFTYYGTGWAAGAGRVNHGGADSRPARAAAAG